MNDRLTIRPFADPGDYRACVALQEDTWGEGFSERVSPAVLKVSQILGGVSAGAFAPDGTLVGFVFGMTGVRGGAVVHWSDMLAVRPEARDGGLGRRLKWYQRERVRALGIERMFWTFDPLQARNAYLNLERLGAVVREYERDMYGASDSPLHRGVGTDRFIALWLLDSGRVAERGEAFAAGRAVPPSALPAGAVAALEAADGEGLPRPGEPTPRDGEEAVTVAIPSDVGAVMAADMQLALEWRRATRSAFEACMRGGYEVSGFVRGNAVSRYVLTPIVEGGAGAGR